MTLTAVAVDAPRPPGRLAERLTDASRLAGRFAHDFDNVLTGVMGFAELAQGCVAEGSDAHRLLVKLLNVAQEGREATLHMHRFGRGGRRSRGIANLAQVWGAELANLRDSRPTAGSVQTSFPERMPAIAVPPDDLRAIIGEVVGNAMDAAGATGTVRASAVVGEWSDAIDALPDTLPPGKYVTLTVSDNGPGIRPEVLAQIAETPFLTSKVRHRGLGLSIALLTLANHGGGLRIAPATPHGTVVTLFLPTHRNDSER